jgi:chemotaxis protein MotB
MAKKHRHEEHENHERWLVSYADFITLLFAFFVVMYAVSRVDNKKLVQASKAIQWALHFEGNGGVGQMPIFDGPPSEGGCAVSVGSSSSAARQQQKIVEQLRKKIQERLRTLLVETKSPQAVTVAIENGKLSLRLSATRFFDTAQASLRPDALPVLDAIAEELVPLKRPLAVVGHTDDSALGSSRLRSNWELSAARAAAVVEYLEQAHHAEAALLTASGRGSAAPLAANDTKEHRELNRRVELTLELPPGDLLSALVP